MITLTATKEKDSYSRSITYIRTLDNKVKAIYINSLKQPRKGTKQITINNFKYNLIWN